MFYRFWAAAVMALTVVAAWASGVDAQTPTRRALRYPQAAAFAGVDDLAAAVGRGDIVWAIDDGDSVPSAFRDAGRPTHVRLAQAAQAAPDAQAPQTPPANDQPNPDQNNNPPPAQSTPTAYGALGSTEPGGITSSVTSDAGAPTDPDAALIRAKHDAATLLRDVPGVAVDAHAPNIHETALRGRRLGQVPAKGSYWFPARQDLDTMMSKIDSQLVDRITTYNGPYSALFGPGLAFYDVELLRAPDYEPGTLFQTHAQTVGQYDTNGEQWLGRQGFWGGDDVWGFRGGYSHRGGSDYETGNGDRLPSSYKSRQADLALGGWATPDSRVDFQYLRLDQTDVEFPGQYFDINALVTDAFDTTYLLENQRYFDRLRVDGWYNRTNFYGDNLRPGKRALLPLDNVQTFPTPGTPGDTTRITTAVDSFTNVAAYSGGFRAGFSWGEPDDELLTAGVDLRYLHQRIDELTVINVTSQQFDQGGDPVTPPNRFSIASSNPLPRSHQSNPGMFVELQEPVSDDVRIRTGGRFDWVAMNAAEFVAGTPPNGPPTNISEALGGPFDQDFRMGSGFITLDYALTDVHTLNSGVGFGMRAPTMTEMYAFGPFIAVLPQYIFTSVFGDPLLDPEKQVQVDIGITSNQDDIRSGFHFYHAWVQDYITLDFLDTGGSSAYAFVNTPRATLAGCEAYGECDLVPMFTAFGSMSYVEGRDHSRLASISRQRQIIAPTSQSDQRSQRLAFDPGTGTFVPVGPTSTVDDEPLAVMAPLASRIGLRMHSPYVNSKWNVEFVANVVDNQDRVATSLRELVTPGYTTYDILAFRQLTDNFTVTAGVRNFTDKYYQTYFDTRQAGNAPITTVFQPGISFFFGAEFTH